LIQDFEIAALTGMALFGKVFSKLPRAQDND
jgi:hypothetical protein